MILNGGRAVTESYAKLQLLPVGVTLSGIVNKAGNTPHQVIGNGFSER
jgi:hypothetical protein